MIYSKEKQYKFHKYYQKMSSMMMFFGFYEFQLVSFNQFFLQDTIFDYMIFFLGPGLVLFFTFYLMWAGRRKNHKIMKLTRNALLEIFRNEFDDLIIDEMSSNGGLLHPKYKKSQDIPFKDFRAVFALEERHLMLSVIIARFSGPNDYLALEANSKKGKIPTKIQIIPNHEEGQIKKHKDLLFQLDDVVLGVKQIDDFFMLRATSQRAGGYFLGEKNLLRSIHNIRDIIVRISIDSADNPAIRIYARINKDLDLEKLHTLFLNLFKRVDKVSEKMIMKKRRN